LDCFRSVAGLNKSSRERKNTLIKDSTLQRRHEETSKSLDSSKGLQGRGKLTIFYTFILVDRRVRGKLLFVKYTGRRESFRFFWVIPKSVISLEGRKIIINKKFLTLQRHLRWSISLPCFTTRTEKNKIFQLCIHHKQPVSSFVGNYLKIKRTSRIIPIFHRQRQVQKNA